MNVKVQSPSGVAYSAEDATFALLPGAVGEIGVLPDHAPLLTSLRIGAMEVRREDRREFLAVAGGFAEITPQGVKVLADAAELAQDIDPARAEQAKRRAHERLEQAQERAAKVDADRARQALLRAINRLSVSERVSR